MKKKTSMKKKLFLSLMLVATGMLSACGGDDPEPTTESYPTGLIKKVDDAKDVVGDTNDKVNDQYKGFENGGDQ